MSLPAVRRAARAVAALALAALLGAAAAPPPRRIVSLNLCADQYLLALADRTQIAGLTRNATDPALSAAAAQARGLHIMRKSAEEVLALRPDLIVGAPAYGAGMMAALAGHHYATVPLKPADSYAAITVQLRAIAAAIGHPDRGEALIARMDRALAGLPRTGHGRIAAYYQRRGYMTGTGTLVDELMHRIGLVNLAVRLGRPALSQVSLEEMIAARPDYLIVEQGTDRITDQGSEMLHHPILAAIPRLRLPQAWTVCGGPAYLLDSRSLSRQVAQAELARRAARP